MKIRIKIHDVGFTIRRGSRSVFYQGWTIDDALADFCRCYGVRGDICAIV